jgi:hypothetical protein
MCGKVMIVRLCYYHALVDFVGVTQPRIFPAQLELDLRLTLAKIVNSGHLVP